MRIYSLDIVFPCKYETSLSCQSVLSFVWLFVLPSLRNLPRILIIIIIICEWNRTRISRVKYLGLNAEQRMLVYVVGRTEPENFHKIQFQCMTQWLDGISTEFAASAK